MESNAIEERVELSMLYDFYGALLKENHLWARQNGVPDFTGHCCDDRPYGV